ncbi:putative alpha-N-arabinofuranosidase 2 [Rhypophila decipiens]|uniref:Alpha-N-arabinofuranosidase 2 n=1 Tax=Rhypophila decipiens TaxID=261697 RepID=A0AAN7B3J0_9PEZI|nr:putative alpha-N-arabinofuranosidase 2 [Rhypophila decipiens]
MGPLYQQRPIGLLISAVLLFLTFFTPTTQAKMIRGGADPTALRVGNTYYSAESAEGGIWVREASSIEGLGASNVRRVRVWEDTLGDIWAPDIVMEQNRTYIYFSAGKDAKHRMYVITANSAPLSGAPYTKEQKLALPDDQWAIDGTYFFYQGQGWFVWSGWESEQKSNEQYLYLCRMRSPTEPVGPRYIISQPREKWETEGINEGPQPIVDPNGQLHIVYSASGSWTDNYCLADLRLKKGGDPTYVWDWYKSNGCIFGSKKDRMMKGWDATLWIDGPGHHTFVLPDGEVKKSPGGTNHIPFIFHGVKKGTPYSWGNRAWYSGSFVWWGSTTYTRANVPGDTSNTGVGLKFFEDPL